MNDNILEIERDEPVATAPAHTTAGYKLDWADAEVNLAGGRFTHMLRRPTADELFKRDDEMSPEIPIGKDGSYQLPDPTAAEEADARIHDLIVISVSGYDGREIPARHKAAAFNSLYKREVSIADGTDIFDDEITVIEEIGSGAEPDHIVSHVMRQPTEAEIRKYRSKSSGGELRPGKRGRQTFVSRSSLRFMAQMYDQLVVRIDGAHVAREVFTTDERAAFLHYVDPLIKRLVVQTLMSELSESLSD